MKVSAAVGKLVRGAPSQEVTLSRPSNALETPAMPRSLEGGGASGRGNTKSQDPGTKTSWASLRNNKNSEAGSLQAEGRVVHGASLGRAGKLWSVHFIPHTGEWRHKHC